MATSRSRDVNSSADLTSANGWIAQTTEKFDRSATFRPTAYSAATS